MVSRIREKLQSKGRLSLFSLVVIPLICVGLSFVGIQSYHWITGQPATPFSFDIGSLWSDNNESAAKPEGLVKKNKVIRPLIILNKTKPEQSESAGYSIPKIAISNRRQTANFVLPNSENQNQFAAFNPENIPSLEKELLDANVLSPLKFKYLKRLEQDYLINPEITPDTKKWYVGFSVSPMLGYRTFGFNSNDLSGVAVSGNTRYSFGITKKERNASDQVLPSFSVGIDFGRNISKRLSIRTGLYYATYGEQLQIAHIDHSDPNYDHAEFHGKSPEYMAFSPDDSEATEGIPFSNRYAVFEIPIGVEYTFLDFTNTHLSVDVGIAYQRLDHVDALVYDMNTDYYYWFSSSDQELFRKNNISTSAGFALSQYVGNTLELFISPRIMFNLRSTYNDNYPIVQKQYSSGLKLGFKQHF